MEILVLTVAVGFAYASYEIAGERGRNQFLWGGLGLVLAFIPLIILYVLPDLSKQRAPTTGSATTAATAPAAAVVSDPQPNPDRRPCPQCGESIPTAAKICRFCKYELPRATTAG